MTSRDELGDLRDRRRREASLRLTHLGLRVQWAPHWEIALRFTGRWWYVSLVTAVLLGTGVVLADCLWQLGGWIVDAEWSKVALLSGLLAAICLTWVIVLTRRLGRLLGQIDADTDTSEDSDE